MNLQCIYCKGKIQERMRFCPKCGRPATFSDQAGRTQASADGSEPLPPQQPVGYAPPQQPASGMTPYGQPPPLYVNREDEFPKTLRTAAIYYYICAGFNAVLYIAMGFPLGLIEIAILLGLSLWMHLGQSKACAVALLWLSVAEVGLFFILIACGVIGFSTANLVGYAVRISAGVYAVRAFSSR